MQSKWTPEETARFLAEANKIAASRQAEINALKAQLAGYGARYSQEVAWRQVAEQSATRAEAALAVAVEALTDLKDVAPIRVERALDRIEALKGGKT
jgi:hypothetical protein